MLSTSNLKSGQASSYFEKDDYYSKEQGPGGSSWLGEGAKKLGLDGGVEQKAFSQVLKGHSPTGELLFSRAVDQKKRRAATDFTFSAPKSVSVAGLVQGDQRVIDAHHIAVTRTLAVLEDRYAETRVMTATGRKKVNTGNLVAAVFAHGTSREAEPQLHSHCVVMNATQIENGKWYSFSNDSAIAHKKLLGQIYQNELAVELQKLGYEIEQREHGQFDIKGYSEELLQTFSTRRGQIEDLVAEWKASGRVLRDADGHPINSELLLHEAANLKTRKVKPQIIEAGQLLQSWKAVLALKGLELPALPAEQAAVPANHAVITETSANRENPQLVQTNPVINDAIAHCGEREAIFKKENIEKFVLEHHIGTHSIADLQQEIAEHSQLLEVGADEKGNARVTTENALQLELQTIRLMQESQGTVPEIAATDFIEQFFEGSTLSDEQRHAIATSCTSTDQIIGWQGSAGAGKTYGLNAFRKIAEAHGYTVSGYAPSSAAAHELAESLSIQTETVARLLISEPLEEETGQKNLWLIDEAGLLSMRGANALLSRAKEQNARVVLVGDTKQLSSVEAGNPFRSLQAGGMTTVHLDEARRQKKAELRQAVQLMANGQVNDSIDVLSTTGHISEIPEETQQITQMVSDFLGLSPAERNETLLLAGTNANRLKLTEQIRQGLQQEGRLGADTFTMKSLQRKDLTVVQGRYAKSYEPGNVIVPIRDYKRQHLVRNECYVVRMVDASTNTLTLETPDGNLIQLDPKVCDRKASYKVLEEEIAPGDRLKWTKNNRVEETRNGQAFTILSLSDKGLAQTIDGDGNHREVDLSNYQHIDYSWIATTYSSQGKTADRVMALLDSATINREAFYVATSRAKNDLQLYTADIGKLREQAEKSKANENVSDYIPLFELADYEQSLSEPVFTTHATANHSGGVAGDVGRSVEYRQQTATRRSQSELSETVSPRSSTPRYGEQFGGVLDGVEEYLRQEEFREEVVWVGEAAPSINSSAQHVERAAGAATRLNEQVERTARRRKLTGSRWPRKRASRKPVEQPKLKVQTGIENAAETAAPALRKRSAPVQTQPSSPGLQHREERRQQPGTNDINTGQSQEGKNKAVENISDYWTLFGVVDYEPSAVLGSSTTTDEGQGIGEAVGSDLSQRQRATTKYSLTEQAMTAETRRAEHSIQQQVGIVESIEEHLRQEDWKAQAAQVEAAAPALSQSIQQIEEAAGAAAQLHRTVEHTAQQRQIKKGSQWPKLAAKQPTSQPTLKTPTTEEIGSAPATQKPALGSPPASAESFEPVELKPPEPGASLRQQLNEFAAVLGYAPGDRMYVRALLPKRLSDELAVKHNLKFEIEENGKKRLIPNTRRGYLTVGSWEFTHIRKNKEPAVHADGLARLTELNQEGRGIYFVVNPGGEKDREISSGRALFWENDEKSKPEQLELARTAGLPLGVVVETNKSIHCYTPLTEAIQDMEAWKVLQERLIQRMDSDPAIRNSSRLMRLPGFEHVRVEGEGADEQLRFTPVTIRHIDPQAKGATEEISTQLPPWDIERWTTEKKEKRKNAGRSQGEAVSPTLATDNPWDIRNFAQYLNGAQSSQNGWLQVQCPSHGGEGHSDNSLHINQSTGQYKCHGGCAPKSVYKAAWQLAETRGWQPPQAERNASINKVVLAPTAGAVSKPVLGETAKQRRLWDEFSQGGSALQGPQRDLVVARKAMAAGLTKKQTIELLAKHSPHARALYKVKGSTPAYNYVSTTVSTAQRSLKQQQRHRKKANEVER